MSGRNYANWLLDNQERLGWGNEETAKQAGTSPTTISNIISGKIRKPHYRTLRKVAGAFGVQVPWEMPEEPGPWDAPPGGTGPKEPRPAPRSLLEEAGAETRWSGLARREWLDATRGSNEEEKGRNLVRVGGETLREQLAVYPYLLSGNEDGIGRPTISEELEDVATEFLFRRLRLGMGLERMLEEVDARSELYRKARALLSELQAFGSLIPRLADEAYRRSRDEADRDFKAAA